MNRIQKISWLTVISLGVAFILSAIAVIILYFQLGFPRAWGGLACMAIGGIAGLGFVIFKEDDAKVTCDERDRQINLLAARASFGISYVVFGILCMGIWMYLRNHGADMVNIDTLPLLFAFAGFTAFFVHALMILILYSRDKADGEPDNG